MEILEAELLAEQNPHPSFDICDEIGKVNAHQRLSNLNKKEIFMFGYSKEIHRPNVSLNSDICVKENISKSSSLMFSHSNSLDSDLIQKLNKTYLGK